MKLSFLYLLSIDILGTAMTGAARGHDRGLCVVCYVGNMAMRRGSLGHTWFRIIRPATARRER